MDVFGIRHQNSLSALNFRNINKTAFKLHKIQTRSGVGRILLTMKGSFLQNDVRNAVRTLEGDEPPNMKIRSGPKTKTNQ